MEPRYLTLNHDSSKNGFAQTSIELDDGSLLRGVTDILFHASVGREPELSIKCFVSKTQLKFLQERTKLCIEVVKDSISPS